jgi:hypothetical protein
VQARLAPHVRNARAVRLAREAVAVGGQGVLVVDARGRIAWHSPQAQRWLGEFFSDDVPPPPPPGWPAPRAAPTPRAP